MVPKTPRSETLIDEGTTMPGANLNSGGPCESEMYVQKLNMNLIWQDERLDQSRNSTQPQHSQVLDFTVRASRSQ